MKVVVGFALAVLMVSLFAPMVEGAEWGEEFAERQLTAKVFRSSLVVGERLSGGAAYRIGAEFKEREFEGFTLPAETQAVTPQGPLINIPYRSPTAKFSRNVMITFDIGNRPYQNEPHIAVNPNNPDHLIMASHDFDVSCAVSYVSFDGGETWRGPSMTAPGPEDSFCSDPVVAFGRDGTAYYTLLSIGARPLRIGRLLYETEVASVTVSVSKDGGVTWSYPYVASRGRVVPAADRAAVSFLDKPWMAVGPDRANPARDAIYVTYTEFRIIYPFLDFYPFVGEPVVEVSIKLVKSVDGGETWTSPVAVSPVFSGLAGDEEARLVQGSNVHVAPDGTVYVAYYDSLDDGPFKGLFTPMVVVSRDGGRTWSRPSPVVPGGTWEQPFFLSPTYFRSWASMFPFIAANPQNSNEVYISFGAMGRAAGDLSDVYFSKSTDGGATWSRPRRINDDLTTRNQFFPALTVSPNGTIHVIWGDMRDDPDNYRYHIYYTRSGDRGETFLENSRVTDYPSNPAYGIASFVGDYWGIAATNNDVYMVWTDSRAGFRGSPNQDIGFARLRAVKSPSIFISPPSGPAGQVITIVGDGFAARQREVFIEFDGVVISSFPTDAAGRFTATIYVPVSGEGAHLIRAIDVLGNVAEATYYTSFGFNNVLDQLRTVREDTSKKLDEMMKKLPSQVDVDKLADAVAERLKPELSRSGSNQMGDMAFGLAIVAVAAAVAAFAIAARRGRKV
ncbi:MAG: sialidase family protein [Candidatus Caldarchaeum sp.]|nr:sialidase family protein [Candidatus Caldarchaeum sp.]